MPGLTVTKGKPPEAWTLENLPWGSEKFLFCWRQRALEVVGGCLFQRRLSKADIFHMGQLKGYGQRSDWNSFARKPGYSSGMVFENSYGSWHYTRHVTNSNGSHTSEDLHAASKMFPLIPFTPTHATQEEWSIFLHLIILFLRVSSSDKPLSCCLETGSDSVAQTDLKLSV